MIGYHFRFTDLLISLLLFFNPSKAGYNDNGDLVLNTPEKQKAFDALKSFQTGVVNPAAYSAKFIQHDLAIADGVAGLQAYVTALNGTATVNTIRIFQDGNIVFSNSDYTFSGVPYSGFDTYRFEDGLIAEHWQNYQINPGKPNLGGHTMTGGPTQATDLDKTEANRALAHSFLDIVLVGNNITAIPLFYGPNNAPIQHYVGWADGVAGIRDGLQALAAEGCAVNLTTHRQVFVEGTFVLITSQGFFGPQSKAVYDLFRADNGKWVEHWENEQNIPPPNEWKNQNGKY
ncbi:hypothetical protein BV898_03197 [Hypsibius exemplaris]|uniref:SnoaL-like domain-containing protein n=1 Tax=Hypsibius exemplaris TaxID=2072580 RepID=A0A1W0X5Z4_HYPEX|nr:hypothetical protein BV898_03197 [Hypsibius exemplaris]